MNVGESLRRENIWLNGGTKLKVEIAIEESRRTGMLFLLGIICIMCYYLIQSMLHETEFLVRTVGFCCRNVCEISMHPE